MSLSLRLARLGMRAILRPLLARARAVRLLRGIVWAGGLAMLPVRGTRRRAWSGPVPGTEFLPADMQPVPVILWFHGGGYVAGSPFTHRGLLARIARAARVRVIAPDYRLAPEHPGGAAFDDGLACVRALIERVLAPGDLILGGDSAGGGLAAAVTAALCASGQPPGGLIGLSPWTDMTGSGASHRENGKRDDMLPAERLGDLVNLVRGPLPPDDPRLSPVFARFPGLPRAYLSVGAEEILRDDMQRLATRLARDGARVTARVQPGAPHVLAFLAPVVPEARAEIRRIGRWITNPST